MVGLKLNWSSVSLLRTRQGVQVSLISLEMSTRSKWKSQINLINKELCNCRNIKITSEDIDKTVKVHNGKTFSTVTISSYNVNKKLGSLVPTKVFKGHKNKKVK